MSNRTFAFSVCTVLSALAFGACNEGDVNDGRGTQTQIGDSCTDIGSRSCIGNKLMMCSAGKLVSGDVVACREGTFYSCDNGKLKTKVCETSCITSKGISRCMDCTSNKDCAEGETCEGRRCQNGSCHVECNLDDRKCVDGMNAWKLCQDPHGDGCNVWSPAWECQNGETCSNGVCRDPGVTQNCNDECSVPYAHECNEDSSGYKTCTVDANGCLKWSDIHPCGEDELCAQGTCWPSEYCTDTCTTIGERTCDPGGYKECIQKGKCREWSEVQPCSSNHICKNGLCEPAGSGCTNECNSRETQCVGNDMYLLCTDTNGDGCVEWSEARYCPKGHYCVSDACTQENVNEPVRYLSRYTHSPITYFVLQNIQSIASHNTSREANHFMKLGASHMDYSSRFVKCFSDDQTGSANEVTLGSYENLSGVISAFQSSSLDSFNRNSVTAVAGKTGAYPINNSFSLLNQEIAATNPRFAFYGFGTNDMGWRGYSKTRISSDFPGYFSALQLYYQNIVTAVDKMIQEGIIPMFIGITPRTDTQSYVSTESQIAISADSQPKYFVTTFDLVMRGTAEAYQLPYTNQQIVLKKISGYGLDNDGIHLNAAASACNLTSSGLAYGMNNRNLYSMQMLDRAWRALTDNSFTPDSSGETFKGTGTPSDPWIISSLPFTHSGNTANSLYKSISQYSCASQYENGPEYYYKLSVNTQTKLRAFVASDTGVDVDLHLTRSVDGSDCIKRNDLGFEQTLEPGTYYFIVDTFTKDASAKGSPGRYLFGVHECDENDPYCG